MKSVVHALLGLSILLAGPSFAATPSATAGASPAPHAVPSNAEHIKAIQDLLAAMQIETVVRGVAGRSRYPSAAQRQAVFAKLDQTPPADIYRRMAPGLVPVISADTATEMARYYGTPYGKSVLRRKYNSGPQIMMPGMKETVAPEEKKERKRAAYVQASKELAAAEPVIDHEAFKLLQAITQQKP